MSVVAAATSVDPRLFPLERGRNFRDLGGHVTGDGTRVRSGRLFRSGTMAHLTAADWLALDRLGIGLVYDLRSQSERAQEPNHWALQAGIEMLVRDEAHNVGDLRALLSEVADGDAMRQAMLRMYRAIPEVHAGAYRDIFRALLAGRTPLLFNCAAGKDRTGVIAALILHVLGVPREAVIEDYALSEKVMDLRADLLANTLSDTHLAVFGLPEAVTDPLFRSDPAYIEAMYAHLDDSHGGVDAYLETVLGVGAEEAAHLRDHLLE